MGRRPARVVAGVAAAAAGAAGPDGDKLGDPAGAHAKAGGGRFGVALNGERHAMYAHHVEVLQASYCGKTRPDEQRRTRAASAAAPRSSLSGPATNAAL